MISVILIGVSLSVDALCISIANGLAVQGFGFRHAVWMALYFGGFQFLMPLVGSLAAGTVSGYVSTLGPFISFFMLAFIGARMVYGALKSGDGEQGGVIRLTNSRLAVMAVATSLDAFAVGVTFAFMEVALLPSCVIIGVVTFFICIVGAMLAKYIPKKSGKNAEILGGVVLIGIGVKIIVEAFLSRG